MLRFVVSDITGERHILRQPLILTIRMDEDIPADDCCAVFAYTPIEEPVGITIYDGDKKVFVGVVDETERLASPTGVYLRLCARSLAAHLLDNEAAPQCYHHPSASLIYERHARPYGIEWDQSDDAVFFGEQQVTKGMSQWTALKNFCTACYSTTPRISADGILRMKQRDGGEPIIFSDDGDGVAYTELREFQKRCTEISRVNVKIADGDGYRYQVDNTDAIRRGIRRERYLNAVLATTPLTCADTMIRNGAGASYGVQIKCSGRLPDKMGRDAIVKSRLFGDKNDLYISGVSYRMDRNGEKTTLYLKRRKN